MADTSTSTYMGMVLPVAGVRAGPQWATDLTTALSTKVDSHNHTSGQGQPVPVSGLSINADLPLNSTGLGGPFNLTGVRSARFVTQSAALTIATDITCLYVSGNNLFYNNGTGQAVQITAGATLSATSLGGISGLPSGSASAAFGSTTFTWRSATNTAATMDVGPVLIRDTALGANGLTLLCPAGVTPYTLTFPTALPGSSGLLLLGSSGVLSAFGTVSGSNLTLAGTLTVGGTISGVTDPSTAQQAATKNYVDTFSVGLLSYYTSGGGSFSPTIAVALSFVTITGATIWNSTFGQNVVLSSANGTLQLQQAGKYLITFAGYSVDTNNTGSVHNYRVLNSTQAVTVGDAFMEGNGSFAGPFSGACIATVNANDVIKLQVQSNSLTSTIGWNYLSFVARRIG